MVDEPDPTRPVPPGLFAPIAVAALAHAIGLAAGMAASANALRQRDPWIMYNLLAAALLAIGAAFLLRRFRAGSEATRLSAIAWSVVGVDLLIAVFFAAFHFQLI